MSQVRLTAFLRMVLTANSKFTESRSSLNSVLKVMRQQVASGTFDLTALRPGIASARKDKRGAKYDTALQYIERSWGRPSLEYKGPNQAAFSNLPARLYVLKDTVVTFREVDTGTQQTHTFSATSTSGGAGGEITANVAFGPTSHAVKAIVFALQPKVTFDDAFAGRSHTDVGVAEHLTLGFDSVPVGVTAAQAGDPLWTIQGPIPANADTARQLKGSFRALRAGTLPGKARVSTRIRRSGSTSAPVTPPTAAS